MKRRVGRPRKDETRVLSEQEERQIRLDSIKCRKVRDTAESLGVTPDKVYYVRKRLGFPIKTDKKSIDKFAQSAIKYLKDGTLPWKDIIYFGGYCERAVIQHIKEKYPDDYEKLYYLIRPVTDLSEPTKGEILSKVKRERLDKKKRDAAQKRFIEDQKRRLSEGIERDIREGKYISSHLPSGLDRRGLPNRFELMNVIVGHDIQVSSRLCGVSVRVMKEWLRELEIPFDMVGAHSREYEGLF